MAGIQDLSDFQEDFVGASVAFPTSATIGTPWVVTDTSSAGAPTYNFGVDHGEATGAFASGVARLALASTSEIENVCLSFGDTLAYDIDTLKYFECRLKANQATWDSTTSFAFGMAGDRNDAIDTIAIAALFRVVGADSTTAVVVETDDGTNNNDDVATGQTLINAYKRFRISWEVGTDDVQFFMDDGNGSLVRVASGTTFDMSGHTGGLQPYFQLQKTADTNTDGVDIDYVKILTGR